MIFAMFELVNLRKNCFCSHVLARKLSAEGLNQARGPFQWGGSQEGERILAETLWGIEGRLRH